MVRLFPGGIAAVSPARGPGRAAGLGPRLTLRRRAEVPEAAPTRVSACFSLLMDEVRRQPGCRRHGEYPTGDVAQRDPHRNNDTPARKLEGMQEPVAAKRPPLKRTR